MQWGWSTVQLCFYNCVPTCCIPVRSRHDEWTVVCLDSCSQHGEVNDRRSPPIFVLTLWIRLSTVLQILIYLPLTLATLSTSAFLLLSLLLCLHSLIHGTMILLWGTEALSVMQVPMHPFLLLVTFNAFSTSIHHPYLLTATSLWSSILTFSGPLFIMMEGMSSLLVVQKLGQRGKRLVSEGEGYQFTLLIGAAAAYVVSAWIIVNVST